jgi:hypothetical protein
MRRQGVGSEFDLFMLFFRFRIAPFVFPMI